MFFQKKIDATIDLKDAADINMEDHDAYLEHKEKNQIELESKDMLALYISALLVFSPIFIILFLILRWALKV